MTPTDFREALDEIGWSCRHLAERLGCHRNLATAWAAGRVAVPDPVATWLERLRRAVGSHPPPEWRVR